MQATFVQIPSMTPQIKTFRSKEQRVVGQFQYQGLGPNVMRFEHARYNFFKSKITIKKLKNTDEKSKNINRCDKVTKNLMAEILNIKNIKSANCVKFLVLRTTKDLISIIYISYKKEFKVLNALTKNKNS